MHQQFTRLVRIDILKRVDRVRQRRQIAPRIGIAQHEAQLGDALARQLQRVQHQQQALGTGVQQQRPRLGESNLRRPRQQRHDQRQATIAQRLQQHAHQLVRCGIDRGGKPERHRLHLFVGAPFGERAFGMHCRAERLIQCHACQGSRLFAHRGCNPPKQSCMQD
jgi:hypothetical protein